MPHQPTPMDKRQRDKLRQARAAEAAASPRPADATSSGSGRGRATGGPARPSGRSGDRWTAFNSFTDVIAPRLTLAERAVWYVMFRHARNGVCQTSERSIATQANIDKATAGRALRGLVELKLVWHIHLSRSKDQASKYGMRPDPSARLAAAIHRDESRRIVARARRDANGGDRRGRRRRSEPGE